MDNSPLQIYKKAYDLQYKEKKLLEAGNIYQELINNFPDSDVSVYASLQLSKIQSNKLSTNTTHKKASSGWFVLLLLIVNLVLTGGVIFVLLMHIQIVNRHKEAILKISQTIGKLYAGKERDALSLLNELKISSRNDITPFVISADIYLKKHDFNKAREEYKALQNICPGNLLVIEGIKRINKEEADYIENQKRMIKLKEVKLEEKKNKQGKKKVTPRYKKIRPRPKIIEQKDITYF